MDQLADVSNEVGLAKPLKRPPSAGRRLLSTMSNGLMQTLPAATWRDLPIPLIAADVKYDDVVQGTEGDCFLVVSLV